MRKLLFIIPVLALCLWSAYAEDVTKLNPDSSKQCALCHYEWMPQFLFELKGTELVDYQKEKVVAEDKMCFSCHNGTVDDSRIRVWSGDMHNMSDKIPEHMNIPVDLPLEGKSLGCRTCHTAHATGNPTQEGVAGSIFLRRENGESQLCEACHTEIGGGIHKSHPLKELKENRAVIEKDLKASYGKLGSQGRVICESCHTPHSPKDKNLLVYKIDNSRICSVCHEDKLNIGGHTYVKGMMNHPVNVVQEDASAVQKTKDSGGKYTEGDKIICMTCHTPHKGADDSLLIVDNGDSAFCISCHNDKTTVRNTKHDMLTIKGFRTKEGKTAIQRGTCESCHDPHGWSMNLSPKDGDQISQSCLSCHKDKGIAKEKVINNNLHNHPIGKSIKDDMKKKANLPFIGKITEFFTEFRRGRSSEKLVTCATCHDVHSKDKNFLRIEAETGELCLTCHNEKEMVEKTLHGKQKLDKSCLSCHKVHNSETKRLLVKPDNDGCLDCHKKGGSAEKMIPGDHSHPVNMVVDRKLDEHFKVTENGMFTCVSCHDPHSESKVAKIDKDFLRGGFEDFDTFCIACHEGQKEVAGSDHDMRKKDSEELCSQCHAVHNAKSGKSIMTLEYDYSTEDDSCKVCHNDKGSADKKVVMEGHKLGKINAHEKYGKFLAEEDGEYFLYCSGCHTVHNNGPVKGEEGTIQNSFLNKKLSENGNFCAGCHEDKKSFGQSKHNVEKFERNNKMTAAKKAEGDTCGACHIVHNSGDYLFDKEFGNDFEKMCQSCHSRSGIAEETKIETSHKMNVKFEKDMDVFLQNGNVVCATCHEPHALDKGMLRDMGEKNICSACHEEQKMVELSEHNLALLDYVDGEIRATAGENPCYVCHKPHNFHKNNKLMWAFKNKDKDGFAFGMCTDCHKKDGIGYKKVPEVLSHEKIFKIFPYKEKFKEFLFNEYGKVSADGAVTCETCHNPHVWKKDMLTVEANVDGDVHNSFLKQNVKNDFCKVCHGEKDAEELYNKYHDKEYRNSRNKDQLEAEVLKNILMIQFYLENYQEKK
ncbi:cytochrome c3 family protein [Deferribacteres bacterium DY0037]